MEGRKAGGKKALKQKERREGRKEGRKDGKKERRKGGSIRTKELEKTSDILIFIFGLNIQSKCIVSGQQNSRTSEIEEKVRNEDVTFKVFQGKVYKKLWGSMSQLKGRLPNKQTNEKEGLRCIIKRQNNYEAKTQKSVMDEIFRRLTPHEKILPSLKEG